jgi:Uncharacterised nucleotidyltransferase
MTALQLSRREEYLLDAALNPDAAVAAASWERWASEIQLEDAPCPELRLLTAVYAHLSRVAPALKLPSKLRGKARATFAANNMLAHGCLPVIEELSRHSPVVLTKGAAICMRFGAWSSRVMGDVDIHVPRQSFEIACEVLSQYGYTPNYGMTWASLVHRSSLRRDSWNLAKGAVKLDLHWRATMGSTDHWLEQNMWVSAEPAEFLGRKVLLQSSEFAFVTSLHHGFVVGTRGDALQTIVDAALLLPVCKADALLPLLGKADLLGQFRDLISILQQVGLSEIGSQQYRSVLDSACDKRDEDHSMMDIRQTAPKLETEKAVLRRPARYCAWEALGRKARIERLMLRLTGPFSKPLAWSGAFQEEYDLRDCKTIDQIGGPGWRWPEPTHTCFWSDRADARLLIPLRHVGDHLIVLGLAEERLVSANSCVDVFANGAYLSSLDFKAHMANSEYCLFVSRRVLFGPWIELSFRPRPYAGDNGTGLALSVPAERLRVLDMQQMSEHFSSHKVPLLHLAILAGEEPQAGKLARIKGKMQSSPFRNDRELPPDFDPLLYVLSYADLFEHEVDPYAHFLHYGRHEGRLWR